ncbi:MAG: hypothetical protein IJ193_02230 [Bacilli bacterium]|nr:hypothetical protein [Bacilli bacterium]
MKDQYFVLNSNNIGKYTNSSSGFTSFSILLCLALSGVCFFLFAGQVDSSKMFLAYYGSVILGVLCLALAAFTYIRHLKKDAEQNNGGYVIIKDFLRKKAIAPVNHKNVPCFYFQNYQNCFNVPIIGTKKEFELLDENKDCYLLFDNYGNCLSIFECDSTGIDSSVAGNMIYSYSEFLELED